MSNNKLVIIAPCYNEEEIIGYSVEQLSMLLDIMINDGIISSDSRVCFVNDGSKDKTAEIIINCSKKNKKVALIDLTRNFGQQYALLAGLNLIEADYYVTIDADLQDDYMLIADMVKKAKEGCDIVYGCRKRRDTDTFFKRFTARLFYKLMNLMGINIRENHSEFRLLTKNAVSKLKEFGERTIFLRGIVQNIGLKSADIYYDCTERLAGKTKYTLPKLIGLAWTAITSFSVLPLRLITITGFLTSIISASILIYAIRSYLKHYSIPGWTSIIMTIAFFCGIIIMSLGIIGEYLSMILIEVKGRPLYQINKTVNL